MSYPYEIHTVPGSQALSKLDELRSRAGGTPIILGNKEAFERVVECMEMNDTQTTEELIEAAEKIDPVAWLRAREEEDAEYYELEQGEWPEGEESPNSTITAHCSVRNHEPYPEVFVTVIPAPQSWMVPCFLRIGNWNSVPKAEEHAALFKYWGQKFGANVACIADDVIEFTVQSPPRTREDALALAREQYVYCADIVHQGVGSVEALAATLLNARVWYFWWD